jgi:hypothetical protein
MPKTTAGGGPSNASARPGEVGYHAPPADSMPQSAAPESPSKPPAPAPTPQAAQPAPGPQAPAQDYADPAWPNTPKELWEQPQAAQPPAAQPPQK